jgi:predicted MFS family arabinose efflux permease
MAMLPVGFAFGAVEVTMPAFADAQGQRQFAGVLIAVWAIGSAVGGAVYGARPRLLPLRRMHLLVASLLPAVMAALALAWSPWSMVALVAIAGLPIAPLIATRNEMAAVVAIPGYETETFTWPLTSLVAGAALGAAAAGALADGAGWRAAIAAATAAAVFGAVVSVSRRSTLRPAHTEAAVS